MTFMNENLRPNNNKPLILIVRLVVFVAFTFFIVTLYSNYKNHIKIEWLSELLVLSILLIATWFYRVSTEWEMELGQENVLTFN